MSHLVYFMKRQYLSVLACLAIIAAMLLLFTHVPSAAVTIPAPHNSISAPISLSAR